MKSKKPSKFGLKKLTLRNLTEAEQAEILGGMHQRTDGCPGDPGGFF